MLGQGTEEAAMTPQERELIAELFDRLAALETAPRDPDAERVIADEQKRAPHAIYPLVQTVLVQDEALKAANAHIQDLEAALGQPGGAQPAGGFLDNMRNTLFGRREAPRSSVPSVTPGAAPGFRSEPAYAPGPGPYAVPPAAGYGGGYGASFLGTAAATAAGMIGGGLLLDGIRSTLGGHRGAFAPAFDHLSAGRASDQGSPWAGGGSDDLARQAGLDDIGRAPGSSGEAAQGRAAGLFDNAAGEADGDADAGAGTDDGGDAGDDFGGGGDSDVG